MPMDEDARSAEERHRLANLFQLLSTLTRMRMQRSHEPEARRQLSWVLDAVGALGVLQQRLLRPQGDDFGGFLEEMAPHWRRKCAGRPVDIEVDAASITVPEHLASALALIVNELVSNALAHGFPEGRAGRVRVSFQRLDAARAALSVVDDGLGYDPETVGDESLGLWLIQGLSGQVRGKLSVEAADGVAARLEFLAPITEG